MKAARNPQTMDPRLACGLATLLLISGCTKQPTPPTPTPVVGPLAFLADETTNSLQVASSPEGQSAGHLVVRSTFPVIFSLDGQAKHGTGSDTRNPSGTQLGPTSYTLTSHDYLTFCGYDQAGQVTVTISERHDTNSVGNAQYDSELYRHTFPSIGICA